MPLRDARGYLWDVIDSCDQILELTEGFAEADYLSDIKTRLATERCLSIIGEALAQARQHFPDSLQDISDVRRIVGFRNRLIHAYLNINDSTVWHIVQTYVPKLRAEAQATLDRLEQDDAS